MYGTVQCPYLSNLTWDNWEPFDLLVCQFEVVRHHSGNGGMRTVGLILEIGFHGSQLSYVRLTFHTPLCFWAANYKSGMTRKIFPVIRILSKRNKNEWFFFLQVSCL